MICCVQVIIILSCLNIMSVHFGCHEFLIFIVRNLVLKCKVTNSFYSTVSRL